jgi:COP9 signalosome complex subunit 3
LLQAIPAPKYTNTILIRLIKNSPYYTFAKGYPKTIDKLVLSATKDEISFKTVCIHCSLLLQNSIFALQDKNWGMVQQAIARAPRWLIRKLTLTYITLGLRDIASQIGVSTEDEVRSLILDMGSFFVYQGYLRSINTVFPTFQIECQEITANISPDGTVTFSDSVEQYSKEDVDKALAQAQAQSKLLMQLERDMNISKEYIAKVWFCVPKVSFVCL